MTTKKSKSNLLDKLPAFFDAGWVQFTFEKIKDLKDDESNKCFGITDFNKFVILLEENMSDKVAHHTIIHEVSHVLSETFGLGGPDEDKEEDRVVSSNEYITEVVTRSFLMFKNLNPELWKLVYEEYYD